VLHRLSQVAQCYWVIFFFLIFINPSWKMSWNRGLLTFRSCLCYLPCIIIQPLHLIHHCFLNQETKHANWTDSCIIVDTAPNLGGPFVTQGRCVVAGMLPYVSLHFCQRNTETLPSVGYLWPILVLSLLCAYL